ncbi:hypothetical protein DORFOR_01080 [Dorea formicigenerans ATCC 27755]|uniref:Uncharacterized protein n=1 Tax=Dorea formicigenerans ATCC 27755 TaxID=411461 RepID=B0G4A2_9FIRM|nr:hypothetical protein DORFOR_01080 [Dorea formicigenerans ATCC 27755]
MIFISSVLLSFVKYFDSKKEIFFIIEKDNLNDKGKIHEKRYVNP